jgi:cell division protein FtsB
VLRKQLLVERILPIAILCTAIVAVPAMVFSPTGLGRLRNLREEQVRVDEEASRLAQEIRRLRAEVEGARNDPRAVERVARDELGLVRQTEVVFQFEK